MGTSDGTIVGTTKVVDNGPNSARFNLVIMSDGYQSSQMQQFAQDTQSFVNALFAAQPFDTLRSSINVHRVNVTSTDSGADDPTPCGGTGATARTYFDAAFCNSGIRRALVVNSSTAITVANAQVPEHHAVMVIVNSAVYGGTGGQVACFSLATGANEIGIHEMGHSAFGLADEYEYYRGCGVDTDRNTHPATEPAEANVTVNSNRDTIKWRDLIAATTAMPTTRNANCAACDPQGNPVTAATVGAFEGAHYYHCGAFRPQFTCRMRALGNPFCAVCQHRIRTVLAPFVRPTVTFGGRPAVFPTNPGANKKSIYDVTGDGRLAQLWDTNRWNLDFPAELAGQTALRFRGDAAVFPTNAGANKKSIYLTTSDGRLAQIWDTDHWNLDFPAELAHQPGLRFVGGVAVFPTNAGANKKSIYAITTDGRLAQVWDTDHWNLDFPAELAGQAGLRFHGVPVVFATNAGANKKSIYAITTDGRLAQVWDTDHWNLDFPAELAGQAGLRFQGEPAVFATNPGANKKSIYAITTDGRLAQIWDTNHWNLDFPAELAGHAGLRFKDGVAVFPTNAGANKKSIYAVTTDGRLAQIWDTDRWNLDFPAEFAGHGELRFQGGPVVFPTNAGANKKSIYVRTTSGRLAQVWDTDHWNLDFPGELV